MRGRVWFCLMLFLLVFTSLALAEDQVIINSNNWEDVYSGSLYAAMLGMEFNYAIDENQGIQLITDKLIDISAQEALLVENEDETIVFGYQSNLENYGLNVEKIESSNKDSANLQLGYRLGDEFDNFIVLDNSYGYNAIIAIPYAIATNSYVIMADRDNIGDVVDFFEERITDKVLLFGRVDREVKEALSGFNTEIINHGDKYADNIDLIGRFLAINNSKQIVFVDGEYLEKGLFQGNNPLIFIGKTNVPETVVDFIDNSGFETGVSVGYDIFDNVKTVREKTGLRMYVRYGQGWGGEIYALNMFPLPSYTPEIKIKAIKYNTITKNLEVVYENQKGIFTYLQGLSYEVLSGEETVARTGDDKPFFLDGDETKALVYPLDLNEFLNEELMVKTNVIYGESEGSLDRNLKQEMVLDFVSVEDKSEIRIDDFYYNPRGQRFEFKLINDGDVDVYVDIELEDIIIGGDKFSFGSEEKLIQTGKKETFRIDAPLEESDYEDNSIINAQIRYGQREGVLIKSLTQEFSFILKEFDYRLIIIIIIILIVISLLWYALKRRNHHG